MAEELPESLKAKLLKKYMRELAKKPREKTVVDIERIVWSKLGDEKAVELMEKAKNLYPQLYPLAIRVFYELLRRGVVREFDGYTTLVLLHRLGIPVKPDLRIKFVKKGREVSFKEYMED